MNERTSYKISKRLDDKGFKAEHTERWISLGDNHVSLRHKGQVENSIAWTMGVDAYTLTELACKLPNKLMLVGQECVFHLVKMAHGDYHASYTGKWTHAPSAKIHANPVEAVAMLIEWLVDSGLSEASNDK